MATIILKHSTVKDKLPSSAQFGEVFVNYNNENPFLATLNNQGQFEKFLSENKTKELFYTKSQVNDIIVNLESGGTITFDDYYTKIESDAKYQSLSGMSSYLTVASAEGLYQPKGDYALVSQLPDLTDYALKSELPDLTDYALKSEIPDTSNFAEKNEIPDVSDFVTSAFTEATYAKKGEVPSIDTYTKSEADEKFQAQSGMTDYALKSEIPDTSNFAEKSEIPDVSNFITSAFTEETYSKLGHTHSYNDLQDKPTIPSIEGLASISDLANYQPISGMSSYLTVASAESTYQPKGDYALVSQIPSVEGFVTSAYTEATYMKIGDVPTDVYTKSETDTLLAGKASSSHTHTASEIIDLDVPKIWKGTLAEYTNLTEIDNDTLYVITDESEQFVTSGDVESMISGFTTLSEVEVLLGGFSPTGHTHVMSDITDLDIPSIEGLASEAWVGANFQPQSGMSEYSTTAHTHDYSEIQNTPDLSGFASLSDIPDTSNFITSAFTEDHYQAKGTYVVPSDLDDYALKTDLPTVPDSYTKTETDNLLAGKASSAHTHSYTALTDLPDLSIYLTEHQDISGLATKQELENYMPNSGMTSYLTVASAESTYQPKGIYVVPSDLNDYALKSELPSIEGLATEAELANYQPVSSMTGYSTTAHTHSYNDLTDKPTIPSTSGLASETWVTNNFAGTGHTHSQYITQTSADSRYARVVSCTQAEYDALVQNDQVEQGVLYCIKESNS